ncbi:MAG: hypothetical protein RBR86_02485 [Pseudobdellovibrionaceae bacterium]|jgi:hypothetical protein|nr:hypothetical protein [Pseudobdellovibrionaceae bacterium]
MGFWGRTIFAGSILAIATLTSLSSAMAQDASTIQSKFIMTTDISLYGNYLTYNPQKDAYDLGVKWPVENHLQWKKMKEYFEILPKSNDLYNPVIMKDPEVIIFIENNPDQISGEDVYFSAAKKILRVKRTPIDSNYKNTKDLYDFFKRQMQSNNRTYSSTEKNININEQGLVVIFRGNTTLTNPSWVVTDPEEIEIYMQQIQSVISKKDNAVIGFELPTEENSFDNLNTFMVYTNLNGTDTKLISINEFGRMRSTRIRLDGYSYEDERDFFKTFLAQAHDEKRLVEESQEKLKHYQHQSDF